MLNHLVQYLPHGLAAMQGETELTFSTAVVPGSERVRCVFCDIFTFTGDAISRLETYLVRVQ
jgi:hypothetical protein